MVRQNLSRQGLRLPLPCSVLPPKCEQMLFVLFLCIQTSRLGIVNVVFLLLSRIFLSPYLSFSSRCTFSLSCHTSVLGFFSTTYLLCLATYSNSFFVLSARRLSPFLLTTLSAACHRMASISYHPIPSRSIIQTKNPNRKYHRPFTSPISPLLHFSSSNSFSLSLASIFAA